MSLIQRIISFLELIFNRSSPEVQKKLQKRKLETDIMNFSPIVYAGGMILPNFGEAIYQLYINTKPLDDLFTETVGGTDIPRQSRFRAQLVFTGFSAEEQEDIESLSYQNRKLEVLEDSGGNDKRTLEYQRHRLEKIISALNGESFKTMDHDLLRVHQLADLCHYNYLTVLHQFDPDFTGASPGAKPNYREVPLAQLATAIEDIYYQAAGLRITNTIANAVIALAQLHFGTSITTEKTDAYIAHLKKIAAVFNHIIPEERLRKLIQLAKEDISYEPRRVSYNESARKDFSTRLQTQFKADEQRIKSEIQDDKIRTELASLFNGGSLLPLFGYTVEMNEKLHETSALAFTSIMPLQILKTFLQVYVSPQVQTILNNIIIEGFFNSPSVKTDFSSIMYAALECESHIQEFEKTIERGKPNDSALLDGYIRDSHKDASFYKKMELMVDSINSQAKKLVQDEVSALHALFRILTDILNDAKKPTSEIISNLKMLLLSPRNRDNTDMLEQQFPNWALFFEVMRNYAIVNTKEVA